MDHANLIGMKYLDALAYFTNNGLIHRVVAENGEFFLATADYVPERVNLHLNEGIVIHYSLG